MKAEPSFRLEPIRLQSQCFFHRQLCFSRFAEASLWRRAPYQEHERVGQSLLRAMQSSGKLDKLLTWVLICILITSRFKFEVLEPSTIADMFIFKKKSKHTWKPKRSCFRVLFPMHRPPHRHDYCCIIWGKGVLLTYYERNVNIPHYVSDLL